MLTCKRAYILARSLRTQRREIGALGAGDVDPVTLGRFLVLSARFRAV